MAALTARGAETRDRIVGAAAALMLERGVAAVSVGDIRAAAGVSSSQLYHYFADREALVLAVIGHQTAAVLGFQEPLLARLDSFAALRAWGDAVVAAQAERARGGCPLGSLAGELADADEQARDALAAAFGRWEGAIAAGLDTMVMRGEMRSDAPVGSLALGLLAALEGGLLLAKVRRDVAPLEAALDAGIARVAAYAR